MNSNNQTFLDTTPFNISFEQNALHSDFRQLNTNSMNIRKLTQTIWCGMIRILYSYLG